MDGLTIQTAQRMLRRFRRDDRGVVTIFACFMIMMMVLVGGIGVDLMHNEMERTRLQNTLDRAVLAAADREQTLDPEAVVRDYFDKAGMSSYLSSVTVNQGLNFRSVEANALTVSETQFMHLMGVDQLKVPAIGKAEERVSKVEISLVLDISGSMSTNNRMTNLKSAANAFVDKLIRTETQDLISINLIPYSEHVNIGREMYKVIPNKLHRHNFSHCLEIPDSEFASAALNTSIIYEQMQHYQWNYNGYANDRTNTVCPRYDYETILPMSQSATALKGQIDQMTPRAGTSIFLGVKWGAALLDPSTRDIVAALAAKNQIDSVFASRPANHNDPETMKTIVLMTDGKNDVSNRISNFAYNTPSHYAHWNNWNFWYYMYNSVHPAYRSYYHYRKYDAAMGDTFTDQICTAAKAQGIVIWGVGLEVDEQGANVLKKCASSPSHFFRVDGTEIEETFTAIASQINQLRLTQ